MGHPSSVDAGCNSTKEFRDTYKIEDSDIANLIKGIPEEVEVPKNVPLIGGTKIKVKENVKSLLDGIKDNPLQPTLIIRFTVQGNCDNFDGITIEVASHRITGCKSGSVTVAGVGIDISLDADISPEQMVVEACKCANGADGERQKRTFHITWIMNLSINPGVGGTFDVADYDVAVYSCCCENFDEEEEEEEEQDGEEEHDGEEEKDSEFVDAARNVSVVYRKTRAVMPEDAGALFAMLGDDQKKKEEEEKKKKFDEEKRRKQEEKAAKKKKPKKHKHHEPEQGGAEHRTNKSKSKKDKHERGQRQKHREQWEKKRKHRHWIPFGEGKKKTQHQPKPQHEVPKPPEHPHSGETPKGGSSPEQPHGPHGG